MSRSVMNEKKLDNLSILVVDDEKDIVEFLTQLLEDNGYRVSSANDGIEAMDWRKRQRVNIWCQLSIRLMIFRRFTLRTFRRSTLKFLPCIHQVERQGRAVRGRVILTVG